MRIIERAEWGARFRDGFGNRPISGIRSRWLHHTVTRSPGERASFEEDCRAWRQVEQIGQDRFGGGISYGYGITQAGRIFRGHSRGRIGAHTAGHNTTGEAIVLVGNYENDRITAPQWAALVWLLQLLGSLTGGHRDTKATACPGRNAYSQIGALNQAAQGAPVEVSRPVPVPPAPSRKNWLGPGDRGENVRRLQAHLNRHYPLYSKLAEDGSYGPATTAVVKEFQRRSFITVDGLTGPVTQTRLGFNLNTPAPRVPQGKSVGQMAREVLEGRHGNGHEVRRRSLGVTAAAYAQVRAEVNRRAGSASRPAGKSVTQMATEVIRGDHGKGHDARRRSLGVSAALYAQVRAEVNRRLS